MKIRKLRFNEFLELPEEERIELQTYCSLGHEYEVDCKNWTFENVRETQQKLAGEVTYKDILEIVSIEIKTPEVVDFHLVLGLFNGIVKSITEISELEAKTLQTIPTAQEAIAQETIGGFQRFGYLPEVDALAKGDILKYEAIEKTKWSICFAKLSFDKSVNDYQKELFKLQTND